MWDYYKKFMEIVWKSPAVVLVGETGSGKTTQVSFITRLKYWYMYVCSTGSLPWWPDICCKRIELETVL